MAKTAIQRFEEKYIPEPNSGCWLWTAQVDEAGYGRFSMNQHAEWAHRASYMLHKGPIPIELELDHLCRVRCCVNPSHLEPVTARENSRRSPLIGGRDKTRCKRGHEFNEENTRWRKEGRRICITCVNIRNSERVR